jgi:SAM-dependent MidA family methyltransferase
MVYFNEGGPKSIEQTKLKPAVVQRLRTCFTNAPFSFADLVEFSNYDPQIGFYSGEKAGIGLFGVNDQPFAFAKIANHSALNKLISKLHEENPDCYKTPAEIYSPYFAIGIARQMETLFELGKIKPIIYEIGAGRATLAKDMLDYWKKYNASLYEKVKYKIIDASSKLINLQRDRLQDHCGKVEWIMGDARQLPFADKNLEGILVNTELLDNLPTACIKRKKITLTDRVNIGDFVQVGYQLEDDRLIEKEMPLTDEIREYAKERPSLLSLEINTKPPTTLNIGVGQRAYIGVGVRNFYQELARVINKGYAMSFDYHYLPPPFENTKGYMHMSTHRNRHPLRLEDNIGDVDVYFSVDCWTTDQIAKNAGFTQIEFSLPQGRFFRNLFTGKNAEHEEQQMCLGKETGTAPIIKDYSNTFALVHSIGLGDYPTNYHQKLDEVCMKHHLQHEDLTLGRPTRYLESSMPTKKPGGPWSNLKSALSYIRRTAL